MLSDSSKISKTHSIYMSYYFLKCNIYSNFSSIGGKFCLYWLFNCVLSLYVLFKYCGGIFLCTHNFFPYFLCGINSEQKIWYSNILNNYVCLYRYGIQALFKNIIFLPHNQLLVQYCVPNMDLYILFLSIYKYYHEYINYKFSWSTTIYCIL
jgi:hypothetical protein